MKPKNSALVREWIQKAKDDERSLKTLLKDKEGAASTILLSDYYVDTRYPTSGLEFSFNEAKEAYQSALKIKRLVLKKIK